MRGYVLLLIVSLLFFISGVMSIADGSAARGCAFVALAAVWFVLALSRRKTEQKGQ